MAKEEMKKETRKWKRKENKTERLKERKQNITSCFMLIISALSLGGLTNLRTGLIKQA
jgi:hypothetical protein